MRSRFKSRSRSKSRTGRYSQYVKRLVNYPSNRKLTFKALEVHVPDLWDILERISDGNAYTRRERNVWMAAFILSNSIDLTLSVKSGACGEGRRFKMVIGNFEGTRVRDYFDLFGLLFRTFSMDTIDCIGI